MLGIKCLGSIKERMLFFINLILELKGKLFYATESAEVERQYKADFESESASTFDERGIKRNEIESRELARVLISCSTPWRTTDCPWEFKSEIRFFEYENMMRLLTWEDTAARSAALTARASATRAEGTERRCEVEFSVMKLVASRSCQPIPQFPEARSQAASEKEDQVYELAACELTRGTTFRGREGFETKVWAAFQARESCITFRIVFSSENSRWSKRSLFLFVHRIQRIHG